MPTTRFHFDDSWSVAAAPDAVADLVADLAGYPDWWPQVLAVAAGGVDRARVLCHSRLPYTLDLVLTRRRREPPVFEVEVAGDLTGWVRITVLPAGTGARLHFEQEVWVRGARAVAARLVRRPLEWNHEQMMLGFRNGLQARLGLRRRT